MTFLPEPTDLAERRAQQQANQTMRALEEINVEYADMRQMPVFPKDVPCRKDGADPRLWDAPSVDDQAESRARESWMRIMARTVCAGCPAVEACLTWALEAQEPEGIWGATTPGERLDMLTQDETISA